ncbi:hypothetical protein UFOVP402_20 [uncultured Caudovirales phage]|uniref:Uncharacterized protein n=1 Tax=uncultured Caudovirales phage TaxID=2100421 RepID=A0A6J5M973_9CAUD|nr:hypothetical protein UFOVP402_20 [uncultured Caudovirales phage]
MAYGLKYRYEWSSRTSGIPLKIDIYEDGFGGVVTILHEMGPEPISINWPGAEMEKEVPVMASEATLTFVQTDSFNIDTFFSNTDQKYQVKFYVSGVLHWVGYVQTDDLQQPYLDPPNLFTLKAVDGLALLKTQELTDDLGDRIWGYRKFIQYLFHCLRKTGDDLPINNWVHIYPSDATPADKSVDPAYDPFYLTGVYGQSYMTAKDEWDSCYNVLIKILNSFKARLFQYQGEWQVVRTGDYVYYNGLLSGSRWTDEVTATATLGKDFSSVLGTYIQQEGRSWVEGRKRAVKFTKLTYNFNQWVSLIRNDRFLEGQIQIPLGSPTEQYRDLPGWTLSDPTKIYGVQEIVNTYAVSTKLVMDDDSPRNEAETSAFPVKEGDKIAVRLRYRNTTPVTSSNALFTFRIVVTNGVTTRWLNQDGKWVNSAVAVYGSWATGEDQRNWKDYSIESVDGFPISGTVTLQFLGKSLSSTYRNEIKDLQITLNSFVYDSAVASGQYDKLTQSGNVIDFYEDEINAADSPVPSAKGAIFYGNDQSEDWRHYGVTEDVRFIRIVNTDLYRSNYRAYKTLTGSSVGFMWNDGGTMKPISPIVTLAIGSLHYLITSLQINYTSETCSFSLVELFVKDGTDDTATPSELLFRYIDVVDQRPEIVYKAKETFLQKVGRFLFGAQTYLNKTE